MFAQVIRKSADLCKELRTTEGLCKEFGFSGLGVTGEMLTEQNERYLEVKIPPNQTRIYKPECRMNRIGSRRGIFLNFLNFSGSVLFFYGFFSA